MLSFIASKSSSLQPRLIWLWSYLVEFFFFFFSFWLRMVCIHYASIPPLPLHIYDVIPHFFQISTLYMFILLICNKWVLKCTQTFVYKLPYVRRRHDGKDTWYFTTMKSVLYFDKSSFDKNWVNVKSLDLQIRNYKTFEVPGDLRRVKKSQLIETFNMLVFLFSFWVTEQAQIQNEPFSQKCCY